MKLIQDAQFALKQKFGYLPNEQAVKLFDQAYHYNSSILPISLLDQISELSYNMEHYPFVISTVINGLTKEVYISDHILKTLIITDYLLKYGCSAIIDDLKDRVYLFKRSQTFKIESQFPVDISIRQKAQHIANQLVNRQLLYKEKEIAKQIKLKLQLNKIRLQGIEGQYKQERSIDDVFENYIFKYLDKFNDKLDEWGDKINQKLDDLIDHLANQDTLGENPNEEYHFPESCMDEIQIVSKPVEQIQFQHNSVQSNAQIVLEKKQVNLLEDGSNKKNEVNLLEENGKQGNLKEINLWE